MAAKNERERLRTGMCYPAYVMTRTVGETEIPDFTTVALSPDRCRERAQGHEHAVPGLALTNPRRQIWLIHVELLAPLAEEAV